jgi:hypothetical protein
MQGAVKSDHGDVSDWSLPRASTRLPARWISAERSGQQRFRGIATLGALAPIAIGYVRAGA